MEDIEIARNTKLEKITEIAKIAGIDEVLGDVKKGTGSGRRCTGTGIGK